MGRKIAACNDKKLNHTRTRQRTNQANCLQRKRDDMEKLKESITKIDSDLKKGFEEFNKLYDEGMGLYFDCYKQTGYVNPDAEYAFNKLKALQAQIGTLDVNLKRFNETGNQAREDIDDSVPFEDTEHTVPSF